MDRLYDECLRLFTLHKLGLKIWKVCWQTPGFWKVVVILFVKFAHSRQMLSQVVFSSEQAYVRLSVYPLIRPHLANAIGLHGDIRPVYVPIRIFIWFALESHLFAYAFHNVVPAILCAKNEFLSLFGATGILCLFLLFAISRLYFVLFVTVSRILTWIRLSVFQILTSYRVVLYAGLWSSLIRFLHVPAFLGGFL